MCLPMRFLAVLATLSVMAAGCQHAAKNPHVSSSEAGALDTEVLDRARLAVEIRDWEGARTSISAVLKNAPGNPKALLLGACLALEEGDFDRARSHADRLSEAGYPVESRMLKSLAASRGADVDWIEAFSRAWAEAGRPDLQESVLFDFGHVESGNGFRLPLQTLAAEAVTADDRAVWALLEIEETWARDLVETALPDLTESGVAYAVLSALHRSDDAENRDALRSTAATFTRRHPESMQFALMAVLFGRERGQPLTTDELAGIERASRLPLARLDHVAAHHARAVRLFSEARHPLPAALAFSSWSEGLGQVASEVLVQGDVPGLSPAERLRLGESLWRIGHAFARLPTFMEALTGNALARRGANLVSDERRADVARRAFEEMRSLYLDWSRSHMAGWPLPALREAYFSAAQDEIALARRLTGRELDPSLGESPAPGP